MLLPATITYSNSLTKLPNYTDRLQVTLNIIQHPVLHDCCYECHAFPICVQLNHTSTTGIYQPFFIIIAIMCLVITFIYSILTIKYNEDLLPLRVPHFRRLTEQDLVFVTDKDAV